MSRALWKHPPVRSRSQTPEVGNGQRRPERKTYVRREVLGLNTLHARIHVHNGIRFVPTTVTEHHLGFKLGSFAVTRRRAIVKSRGRKPGKLRK